jgi:hypothetical protein
MKVLVLKLLLFIFIALGYSTQVTACRFTVREIGFSTLSQDIYSLVIVDANAIATDVQWRHIRERLKDSNIRLQVLHPEDDHPFVKHIKREELTFPAKVLIGPDDKLLILSDYSLAEVLEFVLDSPIRQRLRGELPQLFAAIVVVEGDEAATNQEAMQYLTNDCERIENAMPHMPKEVRYGPIIIKLKREDVIQEKVLLWSLGLDDAPEEPVALVIYGRGRFMGERVNVASIRQGHVYNLLSMIGADCECGLDKKWMLGHQLPLLWSAQTRKQLSEEVGFDVDNPMILAEMSRILAKETETDRDDAVAFGPQVIKIDDHLSKSYPEEPNQPEPIFSAAPPLLAWYLLGGVLVLSLVVGGLIWWRKAS